MQRRHPEGLPDLFLDRSLGRQQVPRLLRAAGLRVHTLSEVYGIPRAAIMAQQHLATLDEITAACRSPGPFLYAVSNTGLRRIDLSG